MPEKTAQPVAQVAAVSTLGLLVLAAAGAIPAWVALIPLGLAVSIPLVLLVLGLLLQGIVLLIGTREMKQAIKDAWSKAKRESE